jgi:DNA-binding transcriptional ArsR family regulator
MTTATAPTLDLDATFAALADPTRRAILATLAERGDVSVAELAAPFAMTQPAISKHLKVLERAGLISRQRSAQRNLSHLEAAPMRAAAQWVETYRHFWEQSFTQLDELLTELQANSELRPGAAAPDNTASTADGESNQ